MRFGAIIAARTGSVRLPGKALLPIMGIPSISLLIRRIKTSRLLEEIVFATTLLSQDDALASAVEKEGVPVFRGSADDVLDRYVRAGEALKSDYIVRITGDCPFVDGPTLDYVLGECGRNMPFDLLTTKPAFPHGIDFEVYYKPCLAEINSYRLSESEREHILNYIYGNESSYKIIRVSPPENLFSDAPLFLLDTPEDYDRMKSMTQGRDDIFISPAQLIKEFG